MTTHDETREVSTATEHDVELPPFFCPVDPVMHPDVELVHERSAQWARRVGLVRTDTELERWYASASAEFYGGMVPHAVTEHFQIAANWVYWGFAFDDAHCDEAGRVGDDEGAHMPANLPQLAGRILRVLESGDESLCLGDRYLLGLCDLARSYRQLATPVQVERWVTAQRRWLFGVVQQNAHRATGGPRSVDEFFLTRLHDCGGPPTESMFEFANGSEVPGEELHSPRVRALTEAFWMIAAMDNDTVSRHKEMLGQRDSHNVVDVLARCHGLNEGEALSTATAYRDRLMTLFLRLREQVWATASGPLRTYLETLGNGIRSNIDWSLRTARYTTVYAADGATKSARIRFRGHCHDTPTDAAAIPLPIPSIAWWWTQLD